ncbi:hypothetical protein [Luteitalea sp.]
MRAAWIALLLLLGLDAAEAQRRTGPPTFDPADDLTLPRTTPQLLYVRDFGAWSRIAALVQP